MIRKIREILQDNFFLKNGTCPICGKVLFHSEDYCCPSCLSDLPLNSGPTCHRCGRGLTVDKIACSHCLRENYPFSGGYAHFHYARGGKKIIAALKFNHRPHLASWISQKIDYGRLPWLAQIDLIEGIPLHPHRQARRGYNQSDYLARGVWRELQARGLSPQLSRQLIRSRHQPPQRGQTGKNRQARIVGVFDLVDPRGLTDKKVLLVDDVLTTGATLAEAAHTLIDGGAAGVYTLVICGLAEM